MTQLDCYISESTDQPQAKHLAEIYAQALVNSLGEDVSPQDAADELAELHKLVESIPGGEEILTSPTVSCSRRLKVVTEIGKFLSPPVAGLLEVLAKNARLELIGMISQACEKVVIREAGEIEMIVRSAVTLDDETKDRIATQLGEALGAKCLIKNIVDPKIIGGLVLQKGDTIFDASVAGKLERLAGSFDENKTIVRHDK